MQIRPKLGPKVCKYYLHRAIWTPIHPYKLLVFISFSICFSILFSISRVVHRAIWIPRGTLNPLNPKPLGRTEFGNLRKVPPAGWLLRVSPLE